MTDAERDAAAEEAEATLFMAAAGLEYDALCAKIVTDGRDPSTVAFAMKQALGRRLKELQSLWDNRLTANTRIADTGVGTGTTKEERS